MKRYRQPRAKPNTLKAQWGKLRRDTPDLLFVWGEGVPSCDARLLYHTFSCGRINPINRSEIDPSFTEELEKRGYDITTLKFSIQKKSCF